MSIAGTYEIELRAVNSVGAGDASSPATISVRATPGAPLVDGVTAGDGVLTVAFTPGDDGGAALTAYQYSTDGGQTWRTRADGTTASPLTITTASGDGGPLVNGELYTVQIRAVNALGAGAASTSTLVAPQGTPDAPSDVALTAGDRSLSLSFTPGDDGGSAITRIEVRLDGGAWVDGGALSSPLTISGLTNGTAYSVELRAVSALGAGDASGPVSGTPRAVAGAPGSVTATVDDAATTVAWAAPLTDGGSAISGYVATLFDQSAGGLPLASCTTDGATSCEVGPLDNGTTYYVGVVALNGAGVSPSSSPRVAVRPTGPPSVEIASISPGATSLTVDVTTDDGGSPLSTYEFRLDGGEWISAVTTTEPFTISGLVTGRAYVVEVRAVNGVGSGPASGPVSATPRTLPAAPTALSATGVAESAELDWSVPSNDGGAPITDYVVQYATNVAGPWTTFVDGTSALTSTTVTGLTNGTSYVFRVAALNAAGTGPVSSLASATPLAAPSAPNLTGLTVGSQFIQAAFTAPTSTGGSAVTGYQYQLDGGEWRNASGTASPLLIPGLTNGRTYSVAIRAVNAVGGGATSNTRTATPYGLPGAVAGFLASPTSNSVQLSWDAASPNGSPITAYNIIRWSARTEGSISATYQTTETSYAVTGLSAGTYYFTVEATNAAGTGQRSSPRASATVGATVPAAPTIGSVSVLGADASIAWTAGTAGSSAITGYVVQYEDTDGRRTLAESATTGSSVTVDLPSVTSPYTLRLAMISAAGVGSFATVQPPLVSTDEVDAVSSDAATVSGTVNANSGSAGAVVEYSTDAADLGTPAAATVSTSPGEVTGSTNETVTAELTGLVAGTTYHARVRATAGVATALGATTTFTTAASLVTSGLDVTYDGQPVELTTMTEPAGLDLERVFVGIDGTDRPESSVPPTDAGTYRVTTSIVDDELSGSEVTTLVISPKLLDLDVSAVERAYDGSTEVELLLDLSGAVEGDDVAVEPDAIRGSLPDPGAGVGRVVTITGQPVVLSGEDAGNYVVAVPGSTTVDIARADQTLSFTSSAPAPLRVGSSYYPAVESDAGLAVELSVLGDPVEGAEAPCDLVDGAVVGLAPGSCVIVASQDGTADVEAAETVGQFVTVAAVDVDPETPTTTTPPTTAPPTTAPPTTAGPVTDAPVSSPASGLDNGRFGLGGAPSGGASGLATGTADAQGSTDTDAGASAVGLEAVGPPMGAAATPSGTGEDAGTPLEPLGEEVAAEEGPTEPREDGTVMGLIADVGGHPFGLALGLLLLVGGMWFLARRWSGDDEEV